MDKDLFVFWRQPRSPKTAHMIIDLCIWILIGIGIVESIAGLMTSTLLFYNGLYNFAFAIIIRYIKFPLALLISFLWALFACIMAIDHLYVILTLITALTLYHAKHAVEALSPPQEST